MRSRLALKYSACHQASSSTPNLLTSTFQIIGICHQAEVKLKSCELASGWEGREMERGLNNGLRSLQNHQSLAQDLDFLLSLTS